jgi:2-polyprenyl-3-methyl-5-hydroxy-6-metoxy-1,4-benzoquinol methylase
MGCGFVYVRRRRTSEEVAKSWDDIWGEGYTSEWPAVKARLFYVAEWLDQTIGLKGKSLLEIGAGEGTFLAMARDRGTWPPCGIEPSKVNVQRMRDKNIECWEATAERCELEQKFDVVCLLWTLENCADCIGMLKRAREWLKPDGYLVVATGSRILVPFKKPMSSYFSDNPADTHCFRFSAETLASAFYVSGFELTEPINRYRDSDALVLIGGLAEPNRYWADYPQEVLDFFKSWSEQFP